jgi:hypothetical protein
MRRTPAILLALLLLPVATASAASAPTRALTRRGISLRYPRAWKVSPAKWNDHPGNFGASIAYLSPQPMRNPCVADGNSISCGPTVDVVRPGGVVVTVQQAGFPGRSFKVGRRIRIGPRIAYLSVGRPGGCAGVHASETLTLNLPTGRDNAYQVTACLRAPTAANARRVRALFRTVRLH